MTNEVLSQAEVESLLKGADAGTKFVRSRAKITRYDPRHIQRDVDDPLRAIRNLHERFGSHFAAALSALLRSKVEVALVGVDRLTYSQFVSSLDNPNCLNVLNAEPLASELVLEINPSILYPIIDRLLGGGGETCTMARRPLTEIEQRLARRITGVFLAELRRTWENVLPLDLELIGVESNPRLVEIAPPGAIVVVFGFELTIGDTRGMMNLCIPLSSIERLGDKLSPNGRAEHDRRQATPASAGSIGGERHGAPLELVVRLAHSRISSGELADLEVGDIITTETNVHSALVVEVEGIAHLRVRPGAFEGRKAVRIE